MKSPKIIFICIFRKSSQEIYSGRLEQRREMYRKTSQEIYSGRLEQRREMSLFPQSFLPSTNLEIPRKAGLLPAILEKIDQKECGMNLETANWNSKFLLQILNSTNKRKIVHSIIN